MNYLSVENISKSYGEKQLFSNISFGINRGDKMALIARNGTGKTTLINIITGNEWPDSGRITQRSGLRTGYLKQNPDFNEGLSVLEAVLDSDHESVAAIRNYEMLLSRITAGGHTPDTEKELYTCMRIIDGLGAWDFENRLREVLTRLGLSDFAQPVGELSGGQKKRLALARVLVEDSDLLILDEPTNHLDIPMIEWLEDYLSRQNLSLLLVTHDRYFLDRVCNGIMELENNSMQQYRGNYAYYLEKKEERAHAVRAENERIQNLYRKELEWMRRMPQARTTKSKARTEAFYELEDKARLRTNTGDLRLETLETRIGGKVLEMNNVSKSFGESLVVDDFTYTFKKGERTGICGSNGVGKTTFIRMILGQMRPDKGKISTGQTIVFGHFSQESMMLAEDRRVIDAVKDVAEVIRTGKYEMSAAQFLYRFGFSHTVQYNYVSSLSGGEKRRLQLLLVLVQNPNFLILDEPTNDLDIQTLNALEDFLSDYRGCLIIISHDRYFLDTLTDHLFVFEGGGHIRDFPGNYTDYSLQKNRELQQKRRTSKTITEKKTSPAAAQVHSNKLTYRESRELEELMEAIASLEQERDKLLMQMNSGQGSPAELSAWSKRFAEIEEETEIKTLRWMELEEKRESLSA